MKKTLTLILLLFSLLTCMAQGRDGSKIMQYIRTAMNFNRAYPQEKVYLHFDNTGYFENETIWFKAYVTRTDDGNFSDLSKVLYVELLNPSGDVVKKSKLHVDERGQANGEFKLDSLLGSGYYEVRAYTRYMTNWGTNACFSRVFPVFKAPQVEGDYSNPTIRTMLYKFRDPNNREDDDSLYTAAINEGIYTNNLAKNVTVKFYPEGGNMVAGRKCRVAMWAVDDNGYPYEMIGQVVDENENTLAVVQTDSTGKGIFEVIPTAGKMALVTTNLKNKVRRFDLPVPKLEGCAIAMDVVSDDMSIELQCTDGMCGKELGYVVMNSGNVLFCDTMTAVPATRLTLSRGKMRGGVNQFTLFGGDGQILAERMFFICPEMTASDSISIMAKTEKLRPCGKVELEACALPNSSFSFSAMDAATLNNGKHGCMKTWMLLSSEVKGYIHNVDYYFEADDEEHRRKADMLMLTQGWRRYDWKLMSGQEKLDGGQMIEDKFYVFGKLREYRKRNKVGGVTMNAYLYNQQGESIHGTTVTDASGNYAFDLPFINGEWKMEINTKRTMDNGEQKRKTYYVAIDRQFSPSSRYITPDESSIVHPNRPNLFVSVPGVNDLEDDEFIPITRRDHVLKNVTVKAKKRYFINDDFLYKNENWGRKNATIYYDVDRELDEIRDRGEDEPTVFEFLAKKNRMFDDPDCLDLPMKNALPNPFYRPDHSTLRQASPTIWDGHMSYGGRPIKWIVDNGDTQIGGAYSDAIIAYGDIFFPVFLDEIKSIYIVPKPSAINPNMSFDDESIVKIFLYLHHKYSTASQKGIRHTYFQGFNTPETFKMEDYTNLPPVEDFRRTLYWNPNVTTDKAGKARIEFFNNSSCTEMFISAEGLSEDGKVIAY